LAEQVVVVAAEENIMVLTMFTMDLVEDKQGVHLQEEQEAQEGTWGVIGVALSMVHQDKQDQDLAEAAAAVAAVGLETMVVDQLEQVQMAVQEEL
jgi:hypothetical protein